MDVKLEPHGLDVAKDQPSLWIWAKKATWCHDLFAPSKLSTILLDENGTKDVCEKGKRGRKGRCDATFSIVTSM